MKKQQITYIFIAIFIILVFLFMLVNTTPYVGYNGYSTKMNLANSASIYEGATSRDDDDEEMTTRNREGLKMAPVENQFQTIVPYLDNARGPQCAGTSNGVTATGGPLCLTQDQQKAMASRGGNTELNNCKPYNM